MFAYKASTVAKEALLKLLGNAGGWGEGRTAGPSPPTHLQVHPLLWGALGASLMSVTPQGTHTSLEVMDGLGWCFSADISISLQTGTATSLCRFWHVLCGEGVAESTGGTSEAVPSLPSTPQLSSSPKLREKQKPCNNAVSVRESRHCYILVRACNRNNFIHT